MFRRNPVAFAIAATFLIGGLVACAGGGSSGGKGGKGKKPLDPDGFELNNDCLTASGVSLEFAQSGLTLHNRFDEDYYRFNITQDSTLVASIGFGHANGDLDLQLLGGNCAPIDSSATAQDVELIIRNVTPGAYIVRVFSPTQEPNTYNIEIKATPSGGPVSPDFLEPNDDVASCTPTGNIAANAYQQIGLSIHDTMDEDWFCTTLPATSTIDGEIVFFQSDGDLDFELYDGTGLTVIDSSNTKTDGESLSAVLPAGNYFWRVWSPTGEDCTYSINLTGTVGGGLAPDFYEPNDTEATASALGTMTGCTAWNDPDLTLDTLFDRDYYAFDTTVQASIQVDLKFLHSQGNINMELLDGNTMQVLTFAGSFTDNERLVLDMAPAGPYIVHVFLRDTKANSYEMTINAFEADIYDVTPPRNDTKMDAEVITVAPGYTQTGLTLDNRLDTDWYTFTLVNQGSDYDVSIDALFSHANGDVDMDLYDANDNLLLFSQSKDDNEALRSFLPPGVYFLRVFGFIGPNGQDVLNCYDLVISTTQSTSGVTPDRYEPNNSFGLATVISDGFDTRDPSEGVLTVHNSADSDYFRFSMTGNGNRTVTIQLFYTAADGDLDVEIYADPMGSPRLVGFANTGNDDELLEVVVPAGASNPYAIRVYGFNGDTNLYDLAVSSANGGGLQADNWEPNDTFQSPNPVFNDLDTGGSVQQNLTIHNAVDLDYIQFSVTQPRSISISLTGLVVNFDPATGGNADNGNDVDVAVLDDQQNLVAIAQTATDDEFLDLNVADGTDYRILIFGFSGAVNSFTFNLSHSAPVPPAPDSFEPNDDCGTARTVPLPVSFPDLTIHDPATADYFRFILGNPDVLTARATFANSLGDLDMELLDDTCGTVIATSATTSNVEEIKENLQPGSYVIRVYAAGPSANNYRLDLFTAAGGGGLQPDQYEFNNDVNSCTPIPRIWLEQDLTIHNVIDEDYYCINLTSSSKIKVLLRFIHAIGDIDCSLWCMANGGVTGGGSGAPDCPRVLASSSSFTDNEELSDGGAPFNLSQGDYYIRVQGSGGGTNIYEMEVRETP